MSRLGRDFSSYQGNLTVADCAGIQFAFVKATEGGGYRNPYAPQQCSMLRNQGVLVGYYHFFQPSVAVIDQLDNFNRMAQALGPTPLPMALDVEVTDPNGWQSLAANVVDFCLNVEKWTNPVPNPHSIVYVNLTFYDNLPGFPWGRWVWLADPSHPSPSRPCLVWQNGDPSVAGQPIDADVFVGTDADWGAFTGSAVAPAPAPTTTDIGDSLQSTPITVSIAGGHGWCPSPVPVAQVIDVVPFDQAPEVAGRYVVVPTFVGVSTDDSHYPNGELEFGPGGDGPAPDGTYGFNVIHT